MCNSEPLSVSGWPFWQQILSPHNPVTPSSKPPSSQLSPWSHPPHFWWTPAPHSWAQDSQSASRHPPPSTPLSGTSLHRAANSRHLADLHDFGVKYVGSRNAFQMQWETKEPLLRASLPQLQHFLSLIDWIISQRVITEKKEINLVMVLVAQLRQPTAPQHANWE